MTPTGTEVFTSSTYVVAPFAREAISTMVDPKLQVEPARSPFVVTSNIRQGSRSPEQPSIDDHSVFLLRPSRDPIIDDPVFGLPPPDTTPRFVFKQDTSDTEDTPRFPSNDASSDTTPPVRTSLHRVPSPPPRIYFGHSAITFVPPFSYDDLERDPSVKGVPRNYRAWARTGRPKVDLEGAERAAAKFDFRAIGLVFPEGSESENEADPGEETERKRRKRRKKQASQAVPLDRPRRTIRKLLEVAPSATPPLQTKSSDEKDELKKGPNSKSTEESDASERRSSSTLLDTDVTAANKRKPPGLEMSNSPATVTPRASRRLYAKKYGPREDSVSSESVSDEEDPDDHLDTPHTSLSPAHRAAAPRSRRSFSPAPRTSSRTRTAPAQTVKHPPSRSGPLPTSRPGHRLSRAILPSHSQSIPARTFPASLQIIQGYPSFYRRYPLITQFHPDDPVGKYIIRNDTQPKRQLGIWNPPRDHRDLYTPRYTKGSGGKKIALCPLCFEDPARGGEGRQEWNHTKTSQHNYHMQYYHGISATRCAPFSPPIAQRITPAARPQTNEKSQLLQGKCHVCKQWIALEGCKVGELKVKELLWWKHAAQCHKDSKLSGEEDVFIEDEAYSRLKEYEAGSSD